MEQPSAIPRPSGLPRPNSRLPVLRSSTSQSQLRAPTPTEQVRKKPSISSLSSLSRTGQPPQPLQKKPSRASLVRSNTPSTATTTVPASQRVPTTTAARRVSSIPSFGSSRASTSSTEPVFKRPFARPPSRQAKAPVQPPRASNVSREDDALGSLEGFRSAPRAASRAGSRAGFHENESDAQVALIEPEPVPEQAPKRTSRPSLSERTIESLSQLPSSPAGGKGRRRSSFFSAENSMPPPLRPASAMSSNGGSRPSTSDGTVNVAPATPRRLGAASSRLSMTAPGKRSVSANVTTPAANTPSRISSVSRPVSTVKKQPLSLAKNLQNTPKARPLSGSKSMVARTPKSRPSLSGMFDHGISPPGKEAAPVTPVRKTLAPPAKKTPDTTRRVSASSNALREHIAKAKAARKSEVAGNTNEAVEKSPKPGSSSNALRAQIAAAKEAARRAKAEPERTSTPPRDAIVPDPQEIASFDFGLDDPFNQSSKGAKSVLRKRIDGARVDGRLNIAAMGLTKIPDDVLQMYQYNAADTPVVWGEVVDLSSLMAADNELECLPEAMFPDIDVEAAMEMDEGGPQFGGIQSIDVHGNILAKLPIGLRRLGQLTRLNLSRNKLSTNAFEVISEITTLRELKLAENDLQGGLPSSLGNLCALETLEVQDNKLTTLPTELHHLTALRTLNISNNQISKVPSELFTTGLITLIATKNRLEGHFFDTDSVPQLQELNVSNNALTAMSANDALELPALKYLNISTNRFTSLPNMEAWTALNTLLFAENKVTSLPDSLYALPVHTIDLTANDIVQLDPRIAQMPLKHLVVAANPLRERKFLTMAPEDILRDLLSRLQVEDSPTQDSFGADVVEEVNQSPSAWQVTPSGTLDLSSKSLGGILDDSSLDAVSGHIRQLYLKQNAFVSIPLQLSQVSHLTVLDLSKNSIESVLSSHLGLPKLKELRLSSNRLTSLTLLTTYLNAKALQTLDVSANRLSGTLPTLRGSFPELISLIASDNGISEVTVDALTGLRTVNLGNNDIERLEPRIGLLAGTLTSLNVEGNKFRVPNYQVLQKGTESVLTWLRDKIPRESWKSDATEFFDADDGTTF